MDKHIDVLIVGAGISGLGLAAHLSKNCPQRSFEIVERREGIGELGIYSAIRYPLRFGYVDFGYNFKPWRKAKILADGASIRQYLHEVVDEFHLDRKIHFKHRVISANYDTALKLWIVEIEDQQGQNQTWYANFLLGCTGYYNYDEGFMPEYLTTPV